MHKNSRIKQFKWQNTHLSSFLLELLNGSLVDSTAFVDQMAGGGGLARIDVADNHDVNMNLFLTHVVNLLWKDIAGLVSTVLTFKHKLHIRVQGI